MQSEKFGLHSLSFQQLTVIYNFALTIQTDNYGNNTDNITGGSPLHLGHP